MSHEGEVFKPIENFENYLISNRGRVFNKKNKKFLKLQENAYGYYHICLSRKKHYTKTIHRLVAETFLPNNDKSKQVNHIDCNKKNNNVNNLEWVTSSENLKHAHKNGLMNTPRGEKRWNAKLNWGKVSEIRQKYYCSDITQVELSKYYKVNQGLISRIINNKFWRLNDEQIYVQSQNQ